MRFLISKEEHSMERITFGSDGEPLIRELNVKVFDLFRLLGSGANEEQIAKDHPGLEKEDFLAAYRYAALSGTASIGAQRLREISRDIKQKLGEPVAAPDRSDE